MGNTIYTVGYEPPLERDNKFLHLGKYACIRARVSGESLTVRWPDGTEATGKIIRRARTSILIAPSLHDPKQSEGTNSGGKLALNSSRGSIFAI